VTAKKVSQTREPAGASSQGQLNQRPRILVVDDDGDIRRLNSEVLTGSGYKVDTAADGDDAWDVLELYRYDLLLTDYDMPKVTGVELLKKLRAAHMTMPVILASGTIPTQELNRHPWLQIDATLPKPYTPDELLVTVRKALYAVIDIAGRNAPPPINSQDPTLAAGTIISLQDSKTGKFMRCDFVWTANIKEALDFLSVKRAVHFGMSELKEPFCVLQIGENDPLGTVIITIPNLPNSPEFCSKGQPAASAGSLNCLSGDGQTDGSAAQLELGFRHRILVVDDDNDKRQLSVNLLAASGYDIEVAKDGVAGWNALQSGNNYDLVVTDNKMPNMTGIEMIAKLRSARITVPVIMATEHLPEHEFARKPWLRPNATLQRPFSNDHLLEIVEKVLRSAAGRRTSKLISE
jgi:CheY-like chemotaxis protein